MNFRFRPRTELRCLARAVPDRESPVNSPAVRPHIVNSSSQVLTQGRNSQSTSTAAKLLKIKDRASLGAERPVTYIQPKIHCCRNSRRAAEAAR